MHQENLNKTISLLIIAVQLGVTFIVTICIYMFFALLDYEGGFESLVGMAIFQPIIAVIISIFSILFCLVLGLPIRLIKTLRKWWSRNFYIAIALTFLGLTFLGLSFMPQFIEQATITRDDLEVTKAIPHAGLAITGWLLTTFSILHTYPPERLIIKVQNILTNLTGIK